MKYYIVENIEGTTIYHLIPLDKDQISQLFPDCTLEFTETECFVKH